MSDIIQRPAEVNWSKGFRVESDGTTTGTKVFDHNGDFVPSLVYFHLKVDTNSSHVNVEAVEAKFETKHADS